MSIAIATVSFLAPTFSKSAQADGRPWILQRFQVEGGAESFGVAGLAVFASHADSYPVGTHKVQLRLYAKSVSGKDQLYFSVPPSSQGLIK